MLDLFSDILSPMVTQKRESTTTVTASNDDSNGNGRRENHQHDCPVCNLGGFQNQNDLAEHIDSHFNPAQASTSKLLSRLGSGDGQSISSMSSSSSTSSASTGNHNQREEKLSFRLRFLTRMTMTQHIRKKNYRVCNFFNWDKFPVFSPNETEF